MGNEDLMKLLGKLQGAGGQALLPSLLDGVATAAEPKSAQSSPVVSAATRVAGGGLTLLPLVSGLLKLFGVGSKKQELPPLEKFELPAPIRAEAGLSRNGDSYLIDRGSGDRIRALTPAAINSPVANAPAVGGTAITVNVQALDSQSFLDRRGDIAKAVREAMLESHSLNDVVSEL